MGAPTLKAVEVENLDAAGEGAFLRLSAGLPLLARELAVVAKAAAELGDDLVSVPAVPRSPLELAAAVADLELLEKALGGSPEASRARRLRVLMCGLGGTEKAATAKYDDDQPRDDHGRWAGAGDGSGPAPMSAEEARRLASADHVYGPEHQKLHEPLSRARAATALAMFRGDSAKAIAHLQATKARARASADEEIRRDYAGKPDPETKKFFDRMVEEKRKEIDTAISMIRSGKVQKAAAAEPIFCTRCKDPIPCIHFTADGDLTEAGRRSLERLRARKDDSAPNTGGDVSTPTLAEQGGALVPAQGKKPKRGEVGGEPAKMYPGEQPSNLPLYREVNLGTEVALTMRGEAAKGSGISLGVSVATNNGPPPEGTPAPKKRPDGKHLLEENDGGAPESSPGAGMATSSVAMRAVAKDGPADEARDEHGRWTSAGGASGTGDASYKEHLLGALRGHYHRDDFDFERAKEEATVDELETEVREAGLHSALRSSKTEKAGPSDEPRDERGRWTTGGSEVGSDEKIVGPHMRRGYSEGLRQIREQRLTPNQAREQLAHMRANAAGPHDAPEDVQHQRGAIQALREWARRDFKTRKSATVLEPEELAALADLEKRVRAEMPQIPTEKLQELATFLRGRGVAVESTKIRAGSLKASQDDLNKAKVERIKAKGLEELLKGPPLLTAHGEGSEHAILDGHHRAAAIAELDPEAEVLCLDVACTIEEAISHALEFPGAERRGIRDGALKARIIVKRAKASDLEDDADDAEERTVFGIVLEPEVVDSQGDIYSEDEIRQSAWRFAERYQHFGLMHRQVVSGVVLLETYLAPVDFSIVDRKGQQQQIKKGTWLLRVRVVDDSIWEAVKDGRLDGFSIGGSAVRKPLKQAKKRPAAAR